MAITTMDALIAGFKPFGEDVVKNSFTAEAAGVMHSTMYIPGRPGAGFVPTPGINGQAVSSWSGAIPIPATVAGQNIYIARLEFANTGGIGAMTIMDRLWHNSGITVTTTTAQAITFGTLPPRDQSGNSLGDGVMAALEVSTATTNAGNITNMSISYTNSAGVAGRTGTISSGNPFPATAVAGTFVPFALQAGDFGIRSVQSITLGTSLVAGTVHLVLYRELASLGTPTPHIANTAGPFELGLPRVYDSSVLWPVYLMISTAGGTSNAQVTFAQG